jgi:hypothetical protein
VNGDVVLVDPSGIPSMVKTMALIDDMVGVDETSEPRVCDGVTISDVCAGLVLSAEKDAEEATVELGPSMDNGGAAIPKVGLLGSKYGIGWYDDLGLFAEGRDTGV